MSNQNMQQKNSRIANAAFTAMVNMWNGIKEEKKFVIAGIVIHNNHHIMDDLTVTDVAADFGACAIKFQFPNNPQSAWLDINQCQLYRVYDERLNKVVEHLSAVNFDPTAETLPSRV